MTYERTTTWKARASRSTTPTYSICTSHPAVAAPMDTTASSLPFLQMKDTIILGDLNAHDTLWHFSLSDDRVKDLVNGIGNSDFGAINEDNPTRLPYISWEVRTHLGSDHLPVIIRIETDIKTITSHQCFVSGSVSFGRISFRRYKSGYNTRTIKKNVLKNSIYTKKIKILGV